MIHLTLRQTKMLAKKADGPFSCYIDAPNGYYGLSTVAVLPLQKRVVIFAPHMWVPKSERTQPSTPIRFESLVGGAA